ncbi:hypothetical protein F2Q68_00025630 [Brassica cretica]|uniref:RNase H type-1 domain-containing protein n=1 Tax=Brassica cretica TaxID=69181 RepID=A0A8S9I8G0_BRACR|nr:hypothetical protein F2Q68_00025630 [Brassica cretica]
MALLYISNADETERRARIERVRQGIAENAADAAVRITKITSDINKDKSIGSMVEHKNPFDTLEREAESSDTSGVAISAPAAVPLRIGFALEIDGAGRSRFFFDNRMVGKEGVEDAVRKGWCKELSGRQVDILERIGNCRRELAKWKKCSTSNAKVNMQRLQISGLLLPNFSSWDATRVRQAFTDHDADIILRLKLKGNQEDGYKWGFTKDGVYTSRSGYRAKEEANVWFEINFPRAEEPQPPLRAQETSVSWVKPPTGFRICNIGVSWISRHVNCEAAWILRDDKGRGILHSRRAFSNVESKREAELLAMQWAVRDMVSTRQPRIVFESSCDQARDTFMNLPSYVEHPSVVNEILLHLRSLHDGAFTTLFERRILLLRIFLWSIEALKPIPHPQRGF